MKLYIDIAYCMNYTNSDFINYEISEKGGGEVIGKAIKIYILARGISQTFVSGKTGISISTLNAILNDNRGLSAEEYFTICYALEVPLETFSKVSA